jgi:glycosyltransferase involved in cell wall biosynthesis
MRILFDGYVYNFSSPGGIKRYFNNIIRRLPQCFIPTIANYQDPTINYPNHPNLTLLPYKRFGWRPSKLSHGLERFYFKYKLAASYPEIVHPTYYLSFNRQELNQYRCPLILTVWDMIHEIFAEQMDSRGQHREKKRKAVLSAHKIICISHNTKRDLLERYSLAESKVIVTHLASDINVRLAQGDEPIPKRPYYLYVGARTSYKNFDGMLTAFAKVVSVRSDIALCIVGSPLNSTEEQRIADLKLTDYIEPYGYASDNHLAKLYHYSIAFVYPSKYEGFGIPPLEAMSCGTPVIASNSSSIPEVVGNAGLLFDPNAINDLVDLLLLLYDSPAERDRCITKGYQRSKLFSWDSTVAQTLAVYRSLV